MGGGSLPAFASARMRASARSPSSSMSRYTRMTSPIALLVRPQAPGRTGLTPRNRSWRAALRCRSQACVRSAATISAE